MVNNFENSVIIEGKYKETYKLEFGYAFVLDCDDFDCRIIISYEKYEDIKKNLKKGKRIKVIGKLEGVFYSQIVIIASVILF